MPGSVVSDMLPGKASQAVEAAQSCFHCVCFEVASINPLGEWLHDYKKGDTNSRMQLRPLYCEWPTTGDCKGLQDFQPPPLSRDYTRDHGKEN